MHKIQSAAKYSSEFMPQPERMFYVQSIQSVQ